MLSDSDDSEFAATASDWSRRLLHSSTRIRSGSHDDGAVDRISLTDISELLVESYWASRFDDFRKFGYLSG